MGRDTPSNKAHRITRRDFIKTVSVGTLALLAACRSGTTPTSAPLLENPELVGNRSVVSIVKIKRGKIDAAVEEAIDLLGGIGTLMRGKERIMLKPNLVSDDPRVVTKPQVIEALADLMKRSGKDISIGEGSAAAGGFNVMDGTTYRTRNPETLDAIQLHIYEFLATRNSPVHWTCR